jgi:carbonic anhydrase
VNKASKALQHLFDSNRAWAADIQARDPQFFKKLSQQQSPQYLWIGCADSRVPANEIVNLLPGDLFVHRNVANVVVHSDLNCLSVLQYAVDVLNVKYILVCGHYGCGGVIAAYRNQKFGLIDNWLRHVQDVRNKHRAQLDKYATEAEAVTRLCELNVIEQVVNVAQTTIVQDAWRDGKSVTVHGVIYGLTDGRLRDLHMSVSSPDEVADAYGEAVNSGPGLK